jgi:hypothetical protein
MFIMEVPYFAVQYVPIVIAQAASAPTGGKGQGQLAPSSKPNYVIFDCQQIENDNDSDSTSAMRSLDPAGAIRNMFQTKKSPIDESTVRVQILQEPKHGKIRTEIDNTGYKFFAYDPTPGYLGKDEVVFLATLGGRLYKVVSTLQVVKIADERSDQTRCPAPQSVKVVESVTPDSKT